MNIKWLGRKSHLDTNSLQVEWLGAEDVKQDDRGSSAGIKKNLMTYVVWLHKYLYFSMNLVKYKN